MSRRVSFPLSEEEYQRLRKLAEDKKVSISKYVKDRVLCLKDEDTFETLWSTFEARLKLFPPGRGFVVSDVYGWDEWPKLDRGDKLAIARLFRKKVSAKADGFEKIEAVGRSSSNVTIYQKSQ